jgi:alkyl hydroperoxide reductase subunit AhpC
MDRIGKKVPTFRLPALMQGTLSYLDSSRCRGRWLVMTFLPFLDHADTVDVDRLRACMEHRGATFFLVPSGLRSVHQLSPPHLALIHCRILGDPLHRLHRTFGIPVPTIQRRAQTVLIDPEGFLRYRLVHDLNQRSIAPLSDLLAAFVNERRPVLEPC